MWLWGSGSKFVVGSGTVSGSSSAFQVSLLFPQIHKCFLLIVICVLMWLAAQNSLLPVYGLGRVKLEIILSLLCVLEQTENRATGMVSVNVGAAARTL